MPELPTAQKSRKGLHRLWHATRYSLEGYRDALKETAIRQEALLAAVLVPLGIYLGKSGVERAVLVGSVVLIVIVELLNTAVERLTDLASPQWHALAKAAKDIGSAAVLTSLVLCVGIWALVLTS